MAGILTTPDTRTDCAVVLCHGFLSNKNSATNKAVTALLRPQGIATFRFDFWGQGESERPFEQLTVGLAVDQAMAALQLMATKGYRRLGLVGSSFGGLVAVLAAARFSVEQATNSLSSLVGVALKCPVSDFPAMLEGEFGKAGMARWRATNTIPNVAGGAGRIRLPFSFYEDCARYNAYAAAASLSHPLVTPSRPGPAETGPSPSGPGAFRSREVSAERRSDRRAPSRRVPTLIVHGDADEYVPLAQSQRLQQVLGETCSLVIIPGADHHFSQPAHFRKMVAGIGQWMVDRLVTCTTR
jgi:pimeloyl-ACP methyl ester carboxylesterase